MSLVLNSHAISTKRYEVQLAVSDYVARFRDADSFMGLCAQCHNYGRRYGCPPFDFDVSALLSHYTTATIIGVQICPEEKRLPIGLAQELMAPVICELSRELLAKEQRSGGLSFGFAGGCMLCGDKPCARITHEPCRHSDKVRASLESYGFDLSKTSKELFGVSLCWSKNGYLPDYLMLICGIFS